MPTPHHKKKLSLLSLAVLGSAIVSVVVIAAGLVTKELKEMNPTCEQVLLRWEHPVESTAAEAAADRAHHPISIPESGQRVHVDADLYRSTGFLEFSWSSVYLVRVGTPGDLVEEAIHPYGPTADAISAGSLPAGSQPVGSVPDGSVPGTRPPTPVEHEPGWSPRAVRNGDVVQVGSGRESVNENVRLTTGEWYLAGDEVYRATVLACE